MVYDVLIGRLYHEKPRGYQSITQVWVLLDQGHSDQLDIRLVHRQIETRSAMYASYVGLTSRWPLTSRFRATGEGQPTRT